MTVIKTTTKVFIVNEKNELLLLKIGVHTQQPERSHTIDLPGGFVDDGEQETDGAIREVKEETGIDLREDQLTLVYSQTGFWQDRDVSVTHLKYLVKLDHTPEISVSWEHASYEWVDFDSVVQQKVLRPHIQVALEYVKQHDLLNVQPTVT